MEGRKCGCAAGAERKDRHQNQETTAASTPAKATLTSTAAGGWAKGNAAALREQKQTEAANIDLTSKAFDEYRANNNLGFADEMDSRRDWAGGRALSAPRPADTGAVAYGDSPAQKLKGSYVPYSQKDEFDRLNEWFDRPRNQELVGKLLEHHRRHCGQRGGQRGDDRQTAVQSTKNIADTQKNWAKVRRRLAATSGRRGWHPAADRRDMDYNPAYPESRN